MHIWNSKAQDIVSWQATYPRFFLMRRSSLILSSAFLFVMLGFLPATGQETRPSIGSYQINTRTLTTQDGLSHDRVHAILQSRDGMIWIGTEFGVNRYDGHNWNWLTRKSAQLSSNVCTRLLEDRAGMIWIAHTDENQNVYTFQSLDLLDPITLTARPLSEISETPLPFRLRDIRDIHQLPDGRIYLSLIDQVDQIYTPGSGLEPAPFPSEFIFLTSIPDGPAWGLLGQQVICLDWSGKTRFTLAIEPDQTIFQLLPDKAGNVLALKGDQLPSELYFPKRKKIWIQTLNEEVGLVNEFTISDAALGDIKIIPEKGSHPMMVANSKQICFLDRNLRQKGAWIDLPVEVQYSSELIQDNNGILWFGDHQGIRLIDIRKNRFRSYLHNLQPNPFQTRGIVEMGKYLFVNGYGMNERVDLTTGKVLDIKPQWTGSQSNMVCQATLLTRNNQLWMATNHLHQLDSLGQLIRTVRLSNPTGRIWSMHEDKRGRIWLGTQNGLHVFDPGSSQPPSLFTRLNTFTDIQNASIWHFLEDSSGMWLATENGLYRLDWEDGLTARYAERGSTTSPLPANTFYFLHKDHNGRLWAATGDAGLIRLSLTRDGQAVDTANILQLDRNKGLPSNELYAILEDGQGLFWISSANGLIRLDPKTLAVRVYRMEDGIPDPEFNRISYHRGASGAFYFGGMNGVIAFHPEDLWDTASYSANLMVSGIRAFSETLDRFVDIFSRYRQQGSLDLNAAERILQINLSLQDYLHSETIRYRYRLLGFTDEWQDLPGNQLVLTALPYGNYTLEIQGLGPHLEVSSSQLSIPLRVSRPYYLTWWFISGILILVASLSMSYYLRRKRQWKSRQEELEHMVAVRTELIRKDKETIEEQAARLRSLDAAKSRFFANISHDLRTPLTLIKGPLETVLQRNRLENHDFTLLHMMRQNVQQLYRRIEDLLDLSTLETHRLKDQPVPLALYRFLRQTLDSYESTARLHGIDLQLVYALPEHLTVLLDQDKLDRIILNLLSNALKFTPRDGRIDVHVTRRAGDLIISVTDTGPGIPEDQLEQIFERFHQVAEDGPSGTGIGLSVCRELATVMNGTITAERAAEGGSRFVLTLPTSESLTSPEPDQETGIPAPLASDPATTTPGLRHTILIVEDHPGMVDYLERLLQEYHLLHAPNGQAALDLLEKMGQENQPVHLILSDVMMPVMDGLELLARLRQDEQWRSIPVIILTARGFPEDRLSALRIGADDYLVKPFQEEELLVRVKNRLQRRPAKSPDFNQALPTPSQASPSELRWLSEVEAIIRDHLGDDRFNIGQLAAQLNMSPRRCQQRIKALTGLTPKAYQREIQLTFARQLLSSGQVGSVSEVSHRVGFRDPHYFSRLYQERFGSMPSEEL